MFMQLTYSPQMQNVSFQQPNKNKLNKRKSSKATQNSYDLKLYSNVWNAILFRFSCFESTIGIAFSFLFFSISVYVCVYLMKYTKNQQQQRKTKNYYM